MAFKPIAPAHFTSFYICPVLKKHIGKSQTRILQQLHYWLAQKNKNYGTIENGIQWIRNSYTDWSKQITDLSNATIRRAFCELEKMGIVQSRTFDCYYDLRGGNQIKSYTINYERLCAIVGDISLTTLGKSLLNMPQKNVKNEQGPCSNEQPLIYTKKLTKKLSSNAHVTKTEKRTSTAVTETTFSTEEKEILNEMISIWNKSAGKARGAANLFPSRSLKMLHAYRNVFGESMDNWRAHCGKICTSKFMMGEHSGAFRIFIDSAITEDCKEKVINNYYICGDRAVPLDEVKAVSIPLSEDEKTTASENMIEPNLHPLLLKIRTYLAKSSNYQDRNNGIFCSWFANAKVSENEAGRVVVVESRFKKDYINNHYRNLVDDLNLDVVMAA